MDFLNVTNEPQSLWKCASKEMCDNFSEERKFSTYHKLWSFLAKSEEVIRAEKPSQIESMVIDVVDEKLTSNDVMVHVDVFSKQYPRAAQIFFLSASTSFLQDNMDVIWAKDGLNILLKKLARSLKSVCKFAMLYKSLRTVSNFPLGAIKLTTVGIKAAMWGYSLFRSFNTLQRLGDELPFIGTVGNQNRFLKHFNGDYSKVQELDKMITKMAGFKYSAITCDQACCKRIEIDVVSRLAELSNAINQICANIVILARANEMEEKHGTDESSIFMGSNNIKRSVLCCNLASLVRTTVGGVLDTQQIEDGIYHESLLVKCFMLLDGLLTTLPSIIDDLVVYPAVIEKRVQSYLPFILAEEIIMEMVKAGGNLQVCHEKINVLSHDVENSNELLERIRKSNYFQPIHEKLDDLFKAENFIGASVYQVEKFFNIVEVALHQYEGLTDVILNE